MKLIAIVGTYHKGGMIDTAVDEILRAAAERGAEVHKVQLLDVHVEFCRNCQLCMQEPGDTRGACPIADDVPAILDQVDQADAIVLASPMNFGTVTALMKRFIERTACYGYWPWQQNAPSNRKQQRTKRAIVVASCAAPAFIGRYFTGMNKLLKDVARLLGANRVDSFFIGLARHAPTSTLSPKARAKATRLGYKLVS